MTNHLKKNPGAVRVVDPIQHEKEGGDLCQLTALEEAASGSSTDFLKHSIFSAVPKEPVTCWDGEITRQLPRALKPYFTAHSEELAKDHLNSPLGDIRRDVVTAHRMYHRLV